MQRIAGVVGGIALVLALSATPAGASTVDTDGGHLNVTAPAGESNEIEITQNAGLLTVIDAAGATTLDPNCAEVDSQTVECDETTVSDIVVNTDDLDDIVRIGAFFRGGPYPATMNGGTGADLLRGSPWGDSLNGNAGVDTLTGDEGADTLRGLADNDTLNGGTEDDRLFGGDQNDTLNGGDNADTLNGGFGGDLFNGGAGSDAASYADRTGALGIYSSIGAFSGNSEDGGFGARDDIKGDVERLIGGSGNDQIWAQTNDDDLVEGGGGDDELMAIGGPTVFRGGPGIDTATYFNRTNFEIRASIGDGANDGQSSGAEGDDILGDVENLVGGALDDVLIGDNDDNRLEGLNGADSLSGLAGDDTAAYTAISPGPGQLPAARTVAVTVDIGANGANDGSSDDQNGAGNRDNVQLDVEDLVGTQSGDTFVGSARENTLDGAGGGDTLRGGTNTDELLGGEGDDVLEGGNGADMFNGGNGTDLASYASRKVAQPVTVTVDSAANDGGTVDDIDGGGPLTTRDDVRNTVENVRGGAGPDSLTGNSFANRLIGGLGADSLFGLGGDDVLQANDGVADTVINCGAGAADDAIEDAIDPAPIGCEL